jgi:hypothetical protein
MELKISMMPIDIAVLAKNSQSLKMMFPSFFILAMLEVTAKFPVKFQFITSMWLFPSIDKTPP